MRTLMIGVAAMALAACSPSETYPVSASDAYSTLTGLGYPAGVYPLPAGLMNVALQFEAVPADNAVRWQFSNGDGATLATVTATVAEDGESESTVTFSYADGPAPDEGRNGKMRQMIKSYVQPLIVEAVDARFENRSFDKALRSNADAMTATASVGDMMKDVDASLEEHIAKEKEREVEREARALANPHNATKPTTDLSKYNN